MTDNQLEKEIARLQTELEAYKNMHYKLQYKGEELTASEVGKRLDELERIKAERNTFLKEKVEREKGCEYCRMELKLIGFDKDYNLDLTYDELRDGELVISNSSHYYLEVFGTGGIDIHFCPMCGKRLVSEE